MRTATAASVGAALEAVLKVRAPAVHASTPLVRQLAVKVGRELALDAGAAAVLDVSVRVRDIGMVGLPDSVVLATTPLTPADWELVMRHPEIGAELLDEQSVVASCAEIVRAHHERWDGDGYPDGRRGDAIPLLSRIIATCDAFVAIATDRPHRRGIGAEAALAQVFQGSGSQFDPRIVEALVAALAGDERQQGPAPAGRRVRGARPDLARAIAEFDVVAIFAPAYERILAATEPGSRTGGELVSTIESDIGLTIAVLRRAQDLRSHRAVANVADAVAALEPAEIREATAALPRAEFPWRTSPLEVLMHRSRVHAQAVTRAADRIAREVRLVRRDDLLVAALLHDVGKLVLRRAVSADEGETERTTAPEQRIRDERRALGVDHASLGGLLLGNWNLPQWLVSTVAAHHTSDAQDEIATFVRLADMVAHHAQGDTVDRRRMLRLCQVCGLAADALRDVLFDLPRSQGSQRRRADPSPLTTRETAVLRVLAEGKVYKAIAEELGVATSTVRTHLHNTYDKLGVDNRAQAVLRATEMGWI
jgi:putative nucleotidyltransferase with HDIG domain